jgi:hypothetical protein
MTRKGASLLRPRHARTAWAWTAPILALLFLTAPLEGRAEEGVLRVKGTQGAYLRVDGKGIGRIPVDGIRLPQGRHEIELAKRGFETHSEEVWIGPVRGESRVIYLHQKRRRDALWRSLLFPGWGSYYNDRSRRGAFFLVMEAGLLAFAWERNGTFEERRDDYESADLSYRSAVTDQAIAEARARRDETYDKMADAESERDYALIGVAVVYGLSVLDALFDFPYGDEPAPGRVALRPAVEERGDRVAVTLRLQF